MDLDIRKNVYENIKGDSINSIISTIDDSVGDVNELALPGLGAILELFWKNLSKDEKMMLGKLIKKELQNF